MSEEGHLLRQDQDLLPGSMAQATVTAAGIIVGGPLREIEEEWDTVRITAVHFLEGALPRRAEDLPLLVDGTHSPIITLV